MAFKLFLAYGLVIIVFLSVALASKWPFDIPTSPSGSSGYRGTSGSWGWGGGK